MGILGWIIIGGIAGWLASLMYANDEQQGVMGNIVVGILGGILGGFLLGLFGIDGVTGFNTYSLLVALIGAIVLLFLWHTVMRRPV